MRRKDKVINNRFLRGDYCEENNWERGMYKASDFKTFLKKARSQSRSRSESAKKIQDEVDPGR
jgi:hypothetical protein